MNEEIRLKYNKLYDSVYLNGVSPTDGVTPVPPAVREWIAFHLLQIPNNEIRSIEELRAESKN